MAEATFEQIEEHLKLLNVGEADIALMAAAWEFGDDDEHRRLYALGDTRLIAEIRKLRAEFGGEPGVITGDHPPLVPLEPGASDEPVFSRHPFDDDGAGECAVCGEAADAEWHAEDPDPDSAVPPAVPAVLTMDDLEGMNVDAVLAWVDGDSNRAKVALEAELEFVEPRKSLVTRLKKIAAF